MSTGKRAAYVQRVTVTIPVIVTGREGAFAGLLREDMADAAVRYVEAALPARMTGATVTPHRGPSGSRYYYPEELTGGVEPEIGLTVTVGRLMA